MSGFVVGPTLGHVWSRRTRNRGLAYRLVGAGTATVGIILAANGCIDCGRDSKPSGTAGALLFVGGSVTYLYGMVREIATAPAAARAHNREIESQVVVTPIATAHGTVAGLAIVGRF